MPICKLRIAGIIKESVVDGFGLRYVIFTQGCPHHCLGCHNPETHDLGGGYEVDIRELLNSINQVKLISGITFSGGEPFLQAASCAKLAQLVKNSADKSKQFNVITYSGYYHRELIKMAQKDAAINEFLNETDILIDGPYIAAEHNPNLPFRGSNNQSIIYLH
jgi:anaerobic ribonucleoside-triphosphate reductase activating protein